MNSCIQTNVAESVTLDSAQFIIESDIDDLDIFNSLIECDFAQALVESKIVNEADAGIDPKEKIKEKFDLIVKKFIEFITNSYTKFIDNIKTIYSSFTNSKIIKNCKISSIDKSWADGCETIVKIPKADVFSIMSGFANLKVFYLDAVFDKIDKAKSIEEVDKISDEFISEMKEFTDTLSEIKLDALFSSKPLNKITDQEIELIKTDACKSYIKSIRAIKKSTDALQIIAKKYVMKDSNTNDESLLNKQNAAKLLVTKSCIKAAIMYKNFETNNLKKIISAERSVLIILINNHNKIENNSESETSTQESVESDLSCMLIESASEEFVEKCFE